MLAGWALRCILLNSSGEPNHAEGGKVSASVTGGEVSALVLRTAAGLSCCWRRCDGCHMLRRRKAKLDPAGWTSS